MLHMGGQNYTTQTIRKAVIADFSKSITAVPDDRLDTSLADLWREWSPAMRAAPVLEDAPPPPVGGQKRPDPEPGLRAQAQAQAQARM